MVKSPAVETPPDVRREVLNAAISIIKTSGVEALSMREVARQANVSHQAPYHYFVDRAGIFAAIAEEGFTALEIAFRHTIVTSNNHLRDSLSTYVRFAIAHPGHARVMFRADICGISTHPATQLAADRAYLGLLDLANQVNPELSKTTDAFLLPTVLWSMAHGLANLIIDGPLMNKMPTELTVDALVDKVGTYFAANFNVKK